jgi:hypothetical protein
MPLLYNTWTQFFQARLEENRSYLELSESPISPFNNATKSHAGNPDRLRLSVASNKFNFILLTGPDKTVLLVHSAVLISQSIGKSPIIVGIQGNRSTSPFRIIPAEAATTAARTGRATVLVPTKGKFLSLTQFLEAGTEKKFLGLKSIKDNNKTEENKIDFSKLPSHVFGHPAILSPLEGRGSIPTGKAGAKNVGQLNNMMKEGDDSDVEAIANFIVGAHLTLAFLWIIGRGLLEPVKLEDPPELDSVDEACQNTLRRLQGKGAAWKRQIHD